MNKKLIGIIIIILGALALVAVIYFVFFFHYGATPVVNNTPTTTPAATVTGPTEATVARVISNQVQNATGTTPGSATFSDTYQADFGVVANNFAERFGSYSNQKTLGLSDDLKLITTAKMQSWLTGYYSQLKSLPSFTEYYSITSKALTNTVNGLDEAGGSATITAQMLRTENKQGIERTFDQAIKLSLVKEGKRWKVDAAYWQ